jgi:AcrR family transcriptional regulator
MAERGRRLTAAARPAQLIDVGCPVFARRGYEATSVEEPAARARISRHIIYEHFGGKEGLHAVLVAREVEYLVRRITEAVGRAWRGSVSSAPRWRSSCTSRT